MAVSDKATFSIVDQSGETSSFQMRLNQIEPESLSDIILAGDALIEAVEAITVGEVRKATYSHDENYSTAARAGNREDKWLVRMRDLQTGEVYKMELPTADPAAPVINQGGQTLLDPTSTQWITLGSAISSNYFFTPNNNHYTLVSVERVGRNL